MRKFIVDVLANVIKKIGDSLERWWRKPAGKRIGDIAVVAVLFVVAAMSPALIGFVKGAYGASLLVGGLATKVGSGCIAIAHTLGVV